MCVYVRKWVRVCVFFVCGGGGGRGAQKQKNKKCQLTDRFSLVLRRQYICNRQFKLYQAFPV